MQMMLSNPTFQAAHHHIYAQSLSRREIKTLKKLSVNFQHSVTVDSRFSIPVIRTSARSNEHAPFI
jgi:hypothetical protein